MGVGCLFSPLVFSRLDVKWANMISLASHAILMTGLGLVFLYPALSAAQLPCLVLSALCFGFAIRPVPFVLMATIFPVKMKSLGVATSQISRAISLLVLMKVKTKRK